jgi:hypothetical protein
VCSLLREPILQSRQATYGSSHSHRAGEASTKSPPSTFPEGQGGLGPSPSQRELQPDRVVRGLDTPTLSSTIGLEKRQSHAAVRSYVWARAGQFRGLGGAVVSSRQLSNRLTRMLVSLVHVSTIIDDCLQGFWFPAIHKVRVESVLLSAWRPSFSANDSLLWHLHWPEPK